MTSAGIFSIIIMFKCICGLFCLYMAASGYSDFIGACTFKYINPGVKIHWLFIYKSPVLFDSTVLLFITDMPFAKLFILINLSIKFTVYPAIHIPLVVYRRLSIIRPCHSIGLRPVFAACGSESEVL